ncbi:MAG TPA: GNAT family N-acetyltransferase [Kofleriaceae bacterium]|nr:GNAT family N-acetyltransferase [Kofleriaceae bacterium]
MPLIEQRSAAHYSLVQLVDIFAAGFEGYLVPIAQPVDALAARMRAEQVDLHLSRVICVDGEPAGLCLLAQRGRRVRVAAMGVASSRRGLGLGRALIDEAIDIARAAGADRLLLEVIASNPAALGLYRSAGFRQIRRLLGHTRAALAPVAAAEHQLLDHEALAAAQATEPDLAWPWQLSPHTLVAAAPLQVHALARDAFALINPANPERLGLRLLYVIPSARRQGRARRLLASIQARHPQASWDIPAVIPEELGAAALAALGFRPIDLHQLEMELTLGGP